MDWKTSVRRVVPVGCEMMCSPWPFSGRAAQQQPRTEPMKRVASDAIVAPQQNWVQACAECFVNFARATKSAHV